MTLLRSLLRGRHILRPRFCGEGGRGRLLRGDRRGGDFGGVLTGVINAVLIRPKAKGDLDDSRTGDTETLSAALHYRVGVNGGAKLEAAFFVGRAWHFGSVRRKYGQSQISFWSC